MQISKLASLNWMDMLNNISISIYLDKRRSKSSGKFPVKLRLYVQSPRIQKLYPTAFEFSEKEFDSIWNTVKPRTEHKGLRSQLQAIEADALGLANKIIPFNLDQFERESSRKYADSSGVQFSYQERIASFKKRDQISTASVYELSMKSLMDFVESQKNVSFRRLTFAEINADWLNDYEYYMTTVKSRSITTVSMYVRALRALFNDALASGDLDPKVYPFGKRKYQVPASKNSKRAMSSKELKVLFEAEPKTKEQAKAKDFWFLSYNCSGINIKDIALLRWKDIREGKIFFVRAKTKNTSKANLSTTEVHLNAYALSVIERYGSERSSKALVFPILSETDNAEIQRSKVKNFTKYINQHIKKLAIVNGLPESISTYWARHSFATTSIRKGAPVFWLQNQLGHTDVKTTQNYVDSTEIFDEKSFSATLMEF